MTNLISRRRALSMLGLVGAGATLGACSITTGGGTTTATLNVAKVETYTKAGISLAGTILATPAVLKLLGATNGAKVQALLASLQGGLTSFEAAAGSALTVSVTTTSAVTLAKSLLSDFQTLLALATAVVPLLPAGTLATSISTAVSAAATIGALFAALLSVLSVSAVPAAVSVPVTTMTEAQALAVLGVR